MNKSVFVNPEDTWLSNLANRSLHDLIEVDFRYALQSQNTNAVRASLGRLQKHELTANDHNRVRALLKCADTFACQNWLTVLRIFHLYDKKLDLGVEWVKHTPTVGEKFQELNHHASTRAHLLKNQVLILRYTLPTPNIVHLANHIAPPKREILVENILAPLSSQWEAYRPSPWDSQTATALCATFPEYTRAVFNRIAASAFAFHNAHGLFVDPSIDRHQFHQELKNQNNEGISSNNLSLLSLDSSMSFNHRKKNMIEGLEQIHSSADLSEQNLYLKRLTHSPYVSVITMSEVLESSDQKIRLKNGLPVEHDERIRKM